MSEKPVILRATENLVPAQIEVLSEENPTLERLKERALDNLVRQSRQQEKQQEAARDSVELGSSEITLNVPFPIFSEQILSANVGKLPLWQQKLVGSRQYKVDELLAYEQWREYIIALAASDNLDGFVSVYRQAKKDLLNPEPKPETEGNQS